MISVELTNVSKVHWVRGASESILGALVRVFCPGGNAFEAVKGVTFSLESGECVGLLGPNGAGKSTLIKLICGIQVPTSGKVRVLGTDPAEKSTAFLRSLGVVFGHKSSLWWDLSLNESFRLAKALYNIDETLFRRNCDELLDALSLRPLLTRPPRTFSLGERVKAELAMNLLHSPRLLLLDEPTIGLDLAAKHEIRTYLARLVRERNLSILLASHDIRDIDQCCSRVLLLNQGRLVYLGSAETLVNECGTLLRVIICSTGEAFSEQEQEAIQRIATELSAESIDLTNIGQAEVLIPSQNQRSLLLCLGEVIKASFQVVPPSLEDALLSRFKHWRQT